MPVEEGYLYGIKPRTLRAGILLSPTYGMLSCVNLETERPRP